MIPRTFLSTYAVNGQQQMVVAFLDNITGLTRWVDYIPVKLAQGGRENSYDNNGFIDVAVVAKSLTSVPFKDYVPVYADTAATDAWQVNFTGYIPYGYAGSGDASLMLDFTSNFQAFDSRITFTRASNATYFNSAGLLTNTSFNALTYSNNLENAAWTKTAATVTANVTTGPFGVVDAERLTEDTATSDHKISQTTASSVATQQVFSIYAKADTRSVLALLMNNGASGSAQFLNFDLAAGTATGSPNTSVGWTGATASIVSVGNGWYRCILTANSAGTAGITATASIVVGGSTNYTGDGTSGLFLYGAQLQTGVISAYIPTTTVANSTPRLDYDPATLAAQGLLIEEQRVNLLTYSNYFDNAAWLTASAAVTANVTTSPTGNVEAHKLIATAASANHYITSGNLTISAGATVTASVYVKAAEYNTIRVTAYNSAVTSGFRVDANLSTVTGTTGTLGTGSATGSSVTSVGGGWYRVTVSGTIDASSTAIVMWVQMLAAGVTPFLGDGSSGIFVFGAQLEAGAFATSYAPSVNTFTSRSTTGSYFDSVGVLQSAAINVARNTYNPAKLAAQPFLLLEEARTNSIRNNTMVGAVAGTPGTIPTNWDVAVSGTGITQQVIGTGTEDGITYIDIKFSGTGSGSSVPQIRPETTTQIVAATGQTWAASYYLRIVGGSTTGCIGTFQQIWQERDAAGVSLTTVGVTIADPTTAALRTQRSILTRTLTDAGTARLTNRIQWTFTNGVAVDITLRIGLPQLEQGAFATSVIPTSTVALTRAADLSSSAQATRAADNAVMTGTNFSSWFNAAEGTIYANAATLGYTGSIYNSVVSLTDTAISTAWLILSYGGNTQFSRRNNSTNAVTITAAVAPGTAVHRVAGGYSNTTSDAASADGAAAVTAAQLTTGYSDLAVLRIGAFAANPSYLNGHIRSITYYPRRLSDAELQSLTT